MSKFATVIAAVLLLTACERQASDESAKYKDIRTSQRLSPKPVALKPIALDDFIVFEKPMVCVWSPTTAQFIDNFLVDGSEGYENALGQPKIPEKYRAAFGPLRLEREKEDDFRVAIMPVSGTWHSLKLVEVASAFHGMDAWSDTLTFREPFETVRAKLNSIGFAFGKDGKTIRDGDFYEGPQVELYTHRNETYLSCWA